MIDSTWADIAIVILILISTVIGIYRGFVREMLTLITWIFAAFIGILYGQDVGDFFSIAQSERLNFWIGVGVLFFSIVLLGFIIKYFICKSFNINGTKPYDRFAGAIFGALRGAVVVILILIAGSDTLKDQVWYKNSSVVSNFKVFADIVLNNMPEDWKEDLKHDVHEIEETVEEL